MTSPCEVAFIQDLQDIAGMASCVQMAGSFCLGSLVAVPALLSEHLGAGYMLCAPWRSLSRCLVDLPTRS